MLKAFMSFTKNSKSTAKTDVETLRLIERYFKSLPKDKQKIAETKSLVKIKYRKSDDIVNKI